MTIDTINRLQRIDHLIRIKGTGNAAELADKVGLSRAHLYQYLNLMKELGAPIKYCKYRQSYYYDEEGSFVAGFMPKSNIIGDVVKGSAIIVQIISVMSFH